MTQQKTLMTADEFLWQYGHLDEHYALVKGCVIEEGMCGALHGLTTSNILFNVGSFVRENDLGRVLPSVGFILETDPDTVRGPDVSFVVKDRVQRVGQAYIPGPPDLAIEVVNFNETVPETEVKVRDYLRTGTRRVWVVYPASRTVAIRRLNGVTATYNGDDVITDEELLPGFSLLLSEIFN